MEDDDAFSAGPQNLRKGKNAARDNARAQKKGVREAENAEKEAERLAKRQRAADNKAEKARRSELFQQSKVIDSEVSSKCMRMPISSKIYTKA